jgi:hypothetical protein
MLVVEPEARFALPLGMLLGNKAQWLLCVPPGLTFIRYSAFCQQGVFMCFHVISRINSVVSYVGGERWKGDTRRGK